MARAKDATPPLEWIVGGLGAVAFAGLIGAATWSAVSSANAPPSVTVQVQRIVQTAEGYAVEVEATNEGDITAASIVLKAELMQAGAVVEQHELEFDYLARHSARRGGFIFERDPRSGKLDINADGYAEP